MGATPRYAAAVFRRQDGSTFVVDTYFSDVNGAVATFDVGAGASATSQQWWTTPEPVTLIDIVLATGMADTHSFGLTLNNAPLKGARFQHVPFLNTNVDRPPVCIPIPAGVNVGFVQSSLY